MSANAAAAVPAHRIRFIALFWAFREYSISRAIHTLTSPRNPLLKAVRGAIARGGLTGGGLCVAEGVHLLEEAVRSGCEVFAVLAAESAALDCDLPVYILTEAVFRGLATTESSQGVIALVRPPTWTLDRVLTGQGLAVTLDGIQDPGNAGAIVRAAEAFGAAGVVFLKGSVSPFNPKTLRAAAGSLFRLPFVHNVEDTAFRAALEQTGLPMFAAMPEGPVALRGADLSRGAILIGSEGRGVRPELSRGAIGVRIPTQGVESLNAAVAAAVILYEARRQRISP
jgi:TrmH family RNA methyltransferase